MLLLLVAPAGAAGEPLWAHDVIGGEDVSTGWRCRAGGGPPAPCDEVPIPAGRKRISVTIERMVTVPSGVSVPVALSLGHFATPTRVVIDGRPAGRFRPGLVVVSTAAPGPGTHTIAIETWVSSYRRRPAWDGAARVGALGRRTTGLLVAGEHPGTRRPWIVQLPQRFDENRPAPLIVALHPWGVGPWAYVGTELLRRASAEGFVVLMPDGLGNSLWVGDAEREALAAIDGLARTILFDTTRVFLFGASMGGAGATTIGYRHPDRFAAVASFFGDSRYERGGYTDAILTTDALARAASCLLYAENGRHLPTLLVHGRLDRTSSPVQTTSLAERLAALGFGHELVLRDDRGHEQRLVDEETPRMLAFFARHHRVERPGRVSLHAVDGATRSAYWLSIEPRRAGAAWSFADVEIDGATVRVHAESNVRRLVIDAARAPVTAGRTLVAPPNVTVVGP